VFFHGGHVFNMGGYTIWTAIKKKCKVFRGGMHKLWKTGGPNRNPRGPQGKAIGDTKGGAINGLL